MTRRLHVPADALLMVCVVVWSLNFSVTRYGLTHGFDALAFAALRFGLATALFTFFARAGGEPAEPVDRRSALVMGAVGVTAILANQVAFIFALKLGKASTLALLFGTLPIFAGIFQRGRHGRRFWTAACVSCAGVVLVAAGTRGGVSGDLGGILIGLVTPATIAAYSVLLAPYVARYSSMRVNSVASLACVVPLTALSVPSLVGQHWGRVPLSAWGALLFASIVAYVFTQLVWLVSVERVGTARASLYVNLQPFLGTLFGVLLLSESLTALQIVGGAVIAAGILIARRPRSRG